MTQPSLAERAEADRAERARDTMPAMLPGQPVQLATGSEAVIDFTVVEEGDPEKVDVKVAWARAMRWCRALPKNSTAEVKDKTGRLLYKFKYRGIDDVVTLAGMAFRQFGVTVVPIKIDVEHRIGQPSTCMVTVTYRITSLGEGEIIGVSRGESIDFGANATIKAEQQAFRLFLTTALCLPTHDPTMDSDAAPILRPQPPTPAALRDEMLNPKTSTQRMRALLSELKADPKLGATRVPVPDDSSNMYESLYDLNVRVGRERAAAQGNVRESQSTVDTKEGGRQ